MFFNNGKKNYQEVLKKLLIENNEKFAFSSCLNPFWEAETYRSIHQRCSIETGFLKNFAKFTGKYLRYSLFFNKTLSQVFLSQVFSFEFCEFFKNTFFYRTPPDNCF